MCRYTWYLILKYSIVSEYNKTVDLEYPINLIFFKNNSSVLQICKKSTWKGFKNSNNISTHYGHECPKTLLHPSWVHFLNTFFGPEKSNKLSSHLAKYSQKPLITRIQFSQQHKRIYTSFFSSLNKIPYSNNLRSSIFLNNEYGSCNWSNRPVPTVITFFTHDVRPVPI